MRRSRHPQPFLQVKSIHTFLTKQLSEIGSGAIEFELTKSSDKVVPKRAHKYPSRKRIFATPGTYTFTFGGTGVIGSTTMQFKIFTAGAGVNAAGASTAGTVEQETPTQEITNEKLSAEETAALFDDGDD